MKLISYIYKILSYKVGNIKGYLSVFERLPIPFDFSGEKLFVLLKKKRKLVKNGDL